MSDYQKTYQKYNELAVKAKTGDPQAKADKAKAMSEIRAIEREAAKSGTVLNPTNGGKGFIAEQAKTDSKRSLQEEYVRKFDNKTVVNVKGNETTLREYHQRRLLGA